MKEQQLIGTEDLEAGMRASRASGFVTIAAITVAMLLLFNSHTLVEWTQQPRPGPVISALQQPAIAWHRWTVELGTASAFEQLRSRLRKSLGM
jgi:hypothetical protein